MLSNKDQLDYLLKRSDDLTTEFNSEEATKAHVAELAQILSDLIGIVKSHIYENDDPGQE